VKINYNDFCLGLDRLILNPLDPLRDVGTQVSGFPKDIDSTSSPFYVRSNNYTDP